MLKTKKGFTLVELLVASLIATVVILASAQATLYFMKSLRDAQKVQEAMSESLDVDFYIRRANKNINLSRIDQTKTFRIEGQSVSALNSSAPAPSVSLLVSKADWVAGGEENPLYEDVVAEFSGTHRPVYIDSHTLEEHILVPANGTIDKKTKRLVFARCDEWKAFKKIQMNYKFPGVTAFYLLEVIKKRPFIRNSKMYCCLPSEPNCESGINENFFKTYVVTLDQSHKVTYVEEFPKTLVGNPSLASGFMMQFGASNLRGVNLQTVTITDRCKTNSGLSPEICKQNLDLESYMKLYPSIEHLLKISIRNLSIRISNDIAQTGVISL